MPWNQRYPAWLVGAGAGDAQHRLDHRRDDRRRGHVLARPGLVVEDARRLVEVPLPGLVEELERVLEVVAVLVKPPNCPPRCGNGRTNTMVLSGLWIFEVGGAARVVYEARRRVLSPQPIMMCISTLVKLFQLETSELAT